MSQAEHHAFLAGDALRAPCLGRTIDRAGGAFPSAEVCRERAFGRAPEPEPSARPRLSFVVGIAPVPLRRRRFRPRRPFRVLGVT